MYHPAITEYIAQQEAPLDLQVPAAKKRLAEQEKAERIKDIMNNADDNEEEEREEKEEEEEEDDRVKSESEPEKDGRNLRDDPSIMNNNSVDFNDLNTPIATLLATQLGVSYGQNQQGYQFVEQKKMDTHHSQFQMLLSRNNGNYTDNSPEGAPSLKPPIMSPQTSIVEKSTDLARTSQDSDNEYKSRSLKTTLHIETDVHASDFSSPTRSPGRLSSEVSPRWDVNQNKGADLSPPQPRATGHDHMEDKHDATRSRSPKPITETSRSPDDGDGVLVIVPRSASPTRVSEVETSKSTANTATRRPRKRKSQKRQLTPPGDGSDDDMDTRPLNNVEGLQTEQKTVEDVSVTDNDSEMKEHVNIKEEDAETKGTFKNIINKYLYNYYCQSTNCCISFNM